MKKKTSIAGNYTLVRETRQLMLTADNTNAKCNNTCYWHISHGSDNF